MAWRSCTVNGSEVLFPFEPYSVQLDYMRAVDSALTSRQNALLESPTGTGKTLCLLCSSLAWLLRQKAERQMYGEFAFSARGGQRVEPLKRILYVSRTHAQLAQVVREFKRTAYASKASMAILASRDHLCVHPNVRKLAGSAANAACSRLRATRSCRFGNGVTNALAAADTAAEEDSVVDIEGIVALGTSKGFCPYFFERERAAAADIVFAPYSYVLDPSLRAQLPVEGSVLIVDEAHNVPSYLTSSSMLTLTATDLAMCFDECKRAMTALKSELDQEQRQGSAASAMLVRSAGGGVAGSDAAQESLQVQLLGIIDVLSFLQRFELRLSELQVPKHDTSSALSLSKQHSPAASSAATSPSLAAAYASLQPPNDGEMDLPVSALADLLAQSNPPVAALDIIDDIVACLARTEGSCRFLPVLRKLIALCYQRRVPLDEETSENAAVPSGVNAILNDDAFRFVVIAESQSGGGSGVRGGTKGPAQYGISLSDPRTSRRTIGVWCLDAAVAARNVLRPFDLVIMTSGTLSPMDHFAAEVGLHFGVTLQNGHVIDEAKQLLVSVLCRSPEGLTLDGSYISRHRDEYRMALGATLTNVARQVPDGMLVCFPSYQAMSDVVGFWQSQPVGGAAAGAPQDSGASSTLWADLALQKSVFVEPRDAKELPEVVKRFQEEAESGRGALLLSIARGKVAEGLDFADRHGRCVVVTGIPFANAGDYFIRLKKLYLTRVSKDRPLVKGKPFTGEEWYRNEALRAVNQCIGRVIRHRSDFGAIILADSRFQHSTSGLSGWVQRSLVVHQHFGSMYAQLTKFFAGKGRLGRNIVRLQASGEVVLEGRQATREDSVDHRAATSVVSSSLLLPSSSESAAAHVQANRQRQAELLDAAQSLVDPLSLVPGAGPKMPLVAETPPPTASSLSPSSSTVVHGPGGSALPSITKTMPTMAALRQRPADAPPVLAPPATPLLPPPSSSPKEFVERLKGLVPAAQYAVFKQCLQDIGQMRHGPSVDDDPAAAERFREIVSRLLTVFAVATTAGLPMDPAAATTTQRLNDNLIEQGSQSIVDGFAVFLPENMKRRYRALTQQKKRPREM